MDVEGAEVALQRLRSRVGETGDLLGAFGGFGAALALPPGLREPVLVTATDGVGTKTEIARRMGRLDTIGQDLVAMCADDVVCHGARPLWFLDYLAVGQVEPEAIERIVGGIADACARIDCQLVGGETAEHSGLMAADAFDLAGLCIGIVERSRLLNGRQAQPGDAVIGLASSGLHANGYSLVRALIDSGDLDLAEPICADGRSLGDHLLNPTRLYARDILDLREELEQAGGRLAGVAHITGGGLAANLPRAVGPDLAVRVQPQSWPLPELMDRLACLAGMDGPELRRTFNAGIGMAVLVDPASVEWVISNLGRRGHVAWEIGGVIPAEHAGKDRYVEIAP